MADLGELSKPQHKGKNKRKWDESEKSREREQPEDAKTVREGRGGKCG